MKYIFLILFTLPLYSQQGYMDINTIENSYITYIAISPYPVDLMRMEKIIYQDDKLFNVEIIKCDLPDNNFLFDGYFPSGHKYRIEILNPATKEKIYTTLKFEVEEFEIK